MSSKSKSQLRTENSNSFPNNNSQAITPAILRNFQGDIIDSMVVSNDSGSFVTTSSFDSGTRIQTFTKADGTTYTNTIPGGSGGATDTGSLLTTASFDSGTRTQTFTKGDGSTFTNIIPGGTINTGSFMITGSVTDATSTFTKGDGSTFGLTVNNVVNATSASHAEFSETAQEVIINVKNTSGVNLVKGTPVYATGVTGENINIASASNDSANTMPAVAVLQQNINANAVGEATVSGKIVGVNTDGFTAGRNIYVNTNGSFTQTKPTGTSLIQNIGVVGKVNVSAGEIVIQGSGRSNDLPNITEGYIWVGDGNGVPEEFSTGSIAFINKNNTFTGTQSFNNISVSGTGSFGYIQSVTGSAKIIGDAFLILNNDTPTERFAGIKIIDSGSTQATASLQFDGSTKDWFAEYTASGDPDNFGVLIQGPEYNTAGSPIYLTSNTIPKSDGKHNLNDSNISDSGTLITLNSNTDVQGNITTTGTVDGVNVSTLNTTVQTVSSSVADLNTFTGSALQGSGTSNTFPIYNGSNSLTDSNLNYDGSSVNLFTPSSPGQFNSFIVNTDGTSMTFQAYILKDNGTYGGAPGDGKFEAYFGETTFDGYDNGNAAYHLAMGFQDGASGRTVIGAYQDGTTRYYKPVTFLRDITAPDNISGSVTTLSIGGTVTASLQDGYAWVGDVNNVTKAVPTSSFAGGASGIFEQTGSFYATTNNLEVTGSFKPKGVVDVDGSIGGAITTLTVSSNTASIDLRTANTYKLDIVGGADTHLSITNFSNSGQSANILLSQPGGATGSISFDSNFKFGQGTSYVPTPVFSAKDIISIASIDGVAYATFINNLS